MNPLRASVTSSGVQTSWK